MGPLDFGDLLAKVEQGFEAFTAHASDMKQRVGVAESTLDGALKRIEQLEEQVAPILALAAPGAMPVAAVVEGATKAIDALVEVVGSGAQAAIAATDATAVGTSFPIGTTIPVADSHN